MSTLLETLGMEFIETTPRKMVVRLPVTSKVHQPAGLLHGGATAVVVETAASMGSSLNCPPEMMPVGIEISCNHLRSKTDGYVEAICVPLHLGRRIHVWDAKVIDEKGTLIAAGRCTIAIVPIHKD